MRSLTDRRRAELNDASASELEHLYRRHAGWLGEAMRRKFGARICCEDLVQETYARLTALASSTHISHPRAFLWKVANRIALDQLRRRRRASSITPVSSDSCAAEQMESVLLGELVASLPPNCRDTFLMSRFAGLSYAEIAQRQSVSVKTVEWRMSRALALLAQHLAE